MKEYHAAVDITLHLQVNVYTEVQTCLKLKIWYFEKRNSLYILMFQYEMFQKLKNQNKTKWTFLYLVETLLHILIKTRFPLADGIAVRI